MGSNEVNKELPPQDEKPQAGTKKPEVMEDDVLYDYEVPPQNDHVKVEEPKKSVEKTSESKTNTSSSSGLDLSAYEYKLQYSGPSSSAADSVITTNPMPAQGSGTTWGNVGKQGVALALTGYSALAKERLFEQPAGRGSLRFAGEIIKGISSVGSGIPLIGGKLAAMGSSAVMQFTEKASKKGVFNHADAGLLVFNNIHQEIKSSNGVGVILAAPVGLWKSRAGIWDEVVETQAMRWLIDKPINLVGKAMGYNNVSSSFKGGLMKPVYHVFGENSRFTSSIETIINYSKAADPIIENADDAVKAAAKAGAKETAKGAANSTAKALANEADDVVKAGSKATQFFSNYRNFSNSETFSAIKNIKAVKFVGRAAPVITVGFGAYEAYEGHKEGDGHKVAKAVGGTAGALAGGAVGAKAGAAAFAAIGVWFGGVGAVPAGIAGGIIGGAIGGGVGWLVGGEVVDKYLGNVVDKFYKKSPEEVASTDKKSPVSVSRGNIIENKPNILNDQIKEKGLTNALFANSGYKPASNENDLAKSFANIQNKLESNKKILEQFNNAQSAIERTVSSGKNVESLEKAITRYESAGKQLSKVSELSKNDIQGLREYRSVLVSKWKDIYDKNSSHKSSAEDLQAINNMKAKVDYIDGILTGKNTIANASIGIDANKNAYKKGINDNLAVASGKLEELRDRRALANFKSNSKDMYALASVDVEIEAKSYLLMVEREFSRAQQNGNELNLRGKQSDINELKSMLSDTSFLNHKVIERINENETKLLALKEKHELNLKNDPKYAAYSAANPQLVNFDGALEHLSQQKEFVQNRDITKTEQFIAVQNKINKYETDIQLAANLKTIDNRKDVHVEVALAKSGAPEQKFTEVTAAFKERQRNDATDKLQGLVDDALADGRLSKKEKRQLLKEAEQFSHLGVTINFEDNNTLDKTAKLAVNVKVGGESKNSTPNRTV
jgi:hypothetical protein